MVGGVLGGAQMGIANAVRRMGGGGSAVDVVETLGIVDPAFIQDAGRKSAETTEAPGRERDDVMEAETAEVPVPPDIQTSEQERTAETGSSSQRDTYKVIQRLRESIPQIAKQAPVSFTSIKSLDSVPGNTLAEKGRALFHAIKGTVTRPGFGDVEINSRSMKDDLSHGIGPAKAAVISAVPEVIRHGEQIDLQKNWKGRMYDGYVFAAPVLLDEYPVYVAAIVKRTSKNRLYLHEVVDSNGNIIKVDNETWTTPTSLAAKSDAGVQTSLSDSKIPQGQGFVKLYQQLLAEANKEKRIEALEWYYRKYVGEVSGEGTESETSTAFPELERAYREAMGAERYDDETFQELKRLYEEYVGNPMEKPEDEERDSDWP